MPVERPILRSKAIYHYFGIVFHIEKRHKKRAVFTPPLFCISVGVNRHDIIYLLFL